MTAKFNTLADCIAIATLAHSKDTDQAGFSYIEHPLRVMKAVQAQGAPPYVQMAAVLHDVTEDTFFTAEMLLAAGVPTAAVEIVKLVDRDFSAIMHRDYRDSYFRMHGEETNLSADDYYYKHIRNNPGALQVKMADIGDNLQPWRLSYLPEKKRVYLSEEKYPKALRLLNEGM